MRSSIPVLSTSWPLLLGSALAIIAFGSAHQLGRAANCEWQCSQTTCHEDPAAPGIWTTWKFQCVWFWINNDPWGGSGFSWDANNFRRAYGNRICEPQLPNRFGKAECGDYYPQSSWSPDVYCYMSCVQDTGG
jgi:hypothetical protein